MYRIEFKSRCTRNFRMRGLCEWERERCMERKITEGHEMQCRKHDVCTNKGISDSLIFIQAKLNQFVLGENWHCLYVVNNLWRYSWTMELLIICFRNVCVHSIVHLPLTLYTNWLGMRCFDADWLLLFCVCRFIVFDMIHKRVSLFFAFLVCRCIS